MVVAEGETHRIVNILKQNPELVQNQDKLFGALGLHGDELEDIKRTVGGDRSGTYGSLTLALNKWISKIGEDAGIDQLIRILKELEFNSSAAQIAKEYSLCDGCLDGSRWHCVPPLIPNFTGRSKELQKIQEYFSCDEMRRNQKILVISGLGGIGKTELAKKFAEEFESPQRNVVHMLAEKDSMLYDGFRSLAQQLKLKTENPISGHDIEIRAIIESVYTCLSKKPTLIIFDNAESYKSGRNEDLYNFMPESFSFPPSFNFPYIIITTRSSNFLSFAENIKLEPFSPIESDSFIIGNLKCVANESDVHELSDALHCFPLALQQATAYINQAGIMRKYGPQEYLAEFQIKSDTMLDYDFQPESGIDFYEKTTMSTWKITLDRIKMTDCGEMALRILDTISYMSTDIDLKFLGQVMNVVDDRKFEDALLALNKYSMFKLWNGQIGIHRLVQHVTRLDLIKRGDLIKTLRKIMKAMSHQLDTKSFKIEDRQHLLSAWKFCTQYSHLIKLFKMVPWRAVVCFRKGRRFGCSHAFGLETLPVLVNFLGDSDSAVLKLKTQLGKLFLIMELYNDSLKILEDVLNQNSNEKILGKIKFNKAVEMYNKVLKLRDLTLRKRKCHPARKVKRCRNYCRNDRESLEEALEIHKQVVKMSSRTVQMQIEVSNIEIPNDRNHHVIGQRSMGKEQTETIPTTYENREKILKSIETFEENLLTIIQTKQYLASSFEHSREYDKAVEIYEDLLRLRQEMLGENHPAVILLRHHIAMNLECGGRHARALEMYQEVFWILGTYLK